MKDLIVVVVLLCSAISSFAQIEKGRSYLSGQIGGGSTMTTYDDAAATGQKKHHAYNVTISYGYLLSDKWAVGLSLNTNGNNITYNNAAGSTKAGGYYISPYARRYFSIGDKFYIHVDGGVKFERSTYKYNLSSVPTLTKDDTKATSVFISPGLSYFIANRFALTANLGSLSYVSSKQTGSTALDSGTQNTIGASFGLTTIILGASIFF
jgi:hypothetical protein